jgi:hypothetical protein
VSHADPPGDSAAAVASRITKFAASLHDAGGVDLVVGITQSPVLRAVVSHYCGADPGEPEYLQGCRLQMPGDGPPALSPVEWEQAEPARMRGRLWSR